MSARVSIRPMASIGVLVIVLMTLVGVSFRVAGADSPDPRGSEVVYIATGTNFPDALGAGPAAALGNGPILLVQTDSVPSQTTTELNRLEPRLIVIVGGTAVVSTAVENTLKGLSFGPTVIRVSGSNRYATAAAVSQQAFPCGEGEVMAGRDRQGVVCRPELSGMWNTQTVDSTGDVGQFTSIALDAFGNPVVSYYDVTNGNLKLARCSDPACSGSKTLTTVDSTGTVGRHTSLVLDSSGYPVISYHYLTSGDLKLARCHDATCTSKTVTTVDSAVSGGQYTSLALDPSGYPVISYYDSGNFDLELARCHDTTCASKTLTTVDSSASVGSFTSLVLDSSGFPVISYYDDTNGDLKLARCHDTTCSSKTLNSVDSDGTAGLYSSLALDRAGNPVIGYAEVTSGGVVMLAHCADSTCTSATITAVHSGGDLGGDLSLVLDPSGNPVVAYHDWINGDLVLARCADANCTTRTIITVDPAGVGRYTSLVLDAAGNPVVSYYDFTTFDLKVASF